MSFWDKIEFTRILSLICDECHSGLGKQNINKLRPLKNSKSIIAELDLINEMQQLLSLGIHYSFEDIEDLSPFLNIRKHEILSFEELKKVANVTHLGNIILDEDPLKIQDFELYKSKQKELILIENITEKFNKTFSFDGEVLDSASAKLRSLRKRQTSLRIKIQKTLKSRIEDRSLKNFLTDEIITQRNDRYVIPVRESSVPFVSGISHGSSSSKSTVYIEPQEVIPLNNEIDLNKSEEKEEIYRILKEFSDMVFFESKSLMQNSLLLGVLDSKFAIARYANIIDAKTPKIIDEPKLKFLEARHPLLIDSFKNKSDVIPFDLTLGEEYNILIISGPNTGGKTVTLKSVGLLTVMALTGIPIPAKKDTEIGVFHRFFADIGDDQSLEDALSTFSSHINTMKKMLEFGDDKTLILIDEIGSSTDPEQGSALAQVFVEELVNKKITGIVTTHFTPLKVFAETSAICMNAAMEFDPQKHIPTYHLKLGIPGNSFALEIASSLGLPDQLISKAKEKVGNQNIDLSELLIKLETQKIEFAKEAYHHKLKGKLLEKRAEEYEKKIRSLDEEAKLLKKKSLKETRAYLSGLQKELQREISEIHKVEIQNRKKKAEELLQSVANKNQKLGVQERKYAKAHKNLVDNPKIGDRVWVEDLDSEGDIVEITKNKLKINLNGFFFTTNKNKVFKAKPQKNNYSVVTNKVISASEKHISTEINLLGNTFDEARIKLDDFIDETYLAGLNKIRVVHGKGTGALRRKIRIYLKRNKRIVEFYSPAPEAGGDGVTVISFG